MNERVLLTGISGYIGQHCASELLNQGFHVVGTVRSLSKVDATRSAIGAVAPVDKLTFVEADLLSEAGWDKAMQGCTFVVHVASPFVLAEPKNEEVLIAPAVEGTKRVINAALRAGVQRLVLTSSTLSMVAGRQSGRYRTDAWSDLNANIGAYAKSKTLAEQSAWAQVAKSNLELVVINPGAVYGPSLGAEVDGQSVAFIKDLIRGKVPMIPNVAMGMVDVRDVARLHVAALTTARAAGQRFIAATSEPITMSHVAETLRNAGYKKVPSRKAPNVAIKLMSLFDREAKGMLPLLNLSHSFDNHATFDVLNWIPTPIEVSLREMTASL